MPALLELQRSFAAGLRDRPQDASAWAAHDGIGAAARLRVYRNNARALFDQALQLTYPVVRQRVGDDYFRQLAHHFRNAHPSRAGDLHEVGRHFASFLETHLAGGPYAWLAELAQLEWAMAEAAVAADSQAADATVLAAIAPELLEATRVRFVPSLRLVAATMPVLAVWRANLSDGDQLAVDLARGAEWGIVHRGPDGVQLRQLARSEFEFVAALARGATLGLAIEESSLPLERLPPLLLALFGDQTVAGVMPGSGA